MLEKWLGKVFGNNEQRKSFAYKFSFLVVFFAFLWWIHGMYCFKNGSRSPNIEQGRIYPMDWHGTIIYLTQTENILGYALPIAGFLVFAFVFILSPPPRLDSFKNERDS